MIANEVQMIGIHSRHSDVSEIVLDAHKLGYVLQLLLSLLLLQFILRKVQNHRLVPYRRAVFICML